MKLTFTQAQGSLLVRNIQCLSSMTALQTLLLRQTNGETLCELNIQVHLTVWDLKLLIEENCNIRPLRQRLCYDMELLTDDCTFEDFNHTEPLVLSLAILRWSDAIRDVNKFCNFGCSLCYYRYGIINPSGLPKRTGSEIAARIEFRCSSLQIQSSERYITHLRNYMSRNCNLGLEETIKMVPTDILAVLIALAGIPRAIRVVLSGDVEAQRKWPLVVMNTLELEYDEGCNNLLCTNEGGVRCGCCDNSYCETCSSYMTSESPNCAYSSKSSIFDGDAENRLDLHGRVTADFLDHRMRIRMLCDIEDYLAKAGPFEGEALVVQAVFCMWKNIANAGRRLARLVLNGNQLRIHDTKGTEMMRFKIVEIHRSLVSYDPPRRFFQDMTRDLTLRYGGRSDIERPGLRYLMDSGFNELWSLVGTTECSCVELHKRTDSNIQKAPCRIKNRALNPKGGPQGQASGGK